MPTGRRLEKRQSDQRNRKPPSRRRSPIRGERKDVRKGPMARRSRPSRSRSRRKPELRPLPRGGKVDRSPTRGRTPGGRERARSRSCADRRRSRRSRRQSGRELPSVESPDDEKARDTETIAKLMRKETNGRQTFGDSQQKDYITSANLFVTSFYRTVNSIRAMKEQARQ